MQDSAAPGWEDRYPRNKAFRARIIYVDPAGKAVRLTFRPHVVAWASAALPPIGSLIEVSLRCPRTGAKSSITLNFGLENI